MENSKVDIVGFGLLFKQAVIGVHKIEFTLLFSKCNSMIEAEITKTMKMIDAKICASAETQFADLLMEVMKPLIKAVVYEVWEERESEAREEARVSEMRLSRKELCERWHISKGTLRNYVNEGKIVPIQLGRRVLFAMDDVMKAESKGVGRLRCCA